MITKAIKARPYMKYKPKIGDILYGGEYFERFRNVPNIQIIMLETLGINTWSVLKTLGVYTSDLQRVVKYACPYLEKEFFWCMPICLGGDVDKYRENAIEVFGSAHSSYVFGTSLAQGHVDFKEKLMEWEPADMTNLFMGSGYTIGTLASDGSREKGYAQVELENGDHLIVRLWKWYNK